MMTHAGDLLHHCFCYFFAFCFATLRGTTLLALGEDDLALSDLNQAAKLNNQKDLYTLVRFFSLLDRAGEPLVNVRICGKLSRRRMCVFVCSPVV